MACLEKIRCHAWRHRLDREQSRHQNGAVLLDIATNPGQVRFWPYSDDRWGLGDDVSLGFVANNFADLINSLQPDPL